MEMCKFKIIGAINKEVICFILFVFIVSCAGSQKKIEVVINKSQAAIEAEKFTGINERYDSDGNLVTKVTYRDGIAHGEYWIFHENEAVRFHGFYDNGKRHGEISEFDMNGNLMAIATYEDGEYLKNVFYKDGKPFSMRDIQKKIEYKYDKNGEVVSEWYYGKDR
jgi:antitoxin component YwqK of YwqJK toxin-antitoxin module